MRVTLFGTVLWGVLVTASVAGHHSFAVFFDEKQNITITGTVTEFRFTNPHAIIALEVKTPTGTEEWRAETNAQTLLRRAGWTKESVKAGDVVTLEGWPSRDGTKYMRMRRLTKADGTVLGLPGGGQGSSRDK